MVCMLFQKLSKKKILSEKLNICKFLACNQSNLKFGIGFGLQNSSSLEPSYVSLNTNKSLDIAEYISPGIRGLALL